MSIDNYDLSIFVEPSEVQFKTELPMLVPPYPPPKGVLSSKEYILTELFEYLRSFHNLVKEARKEAEIETLLDFPREFTIDNYIALLHKVPYKNRSVVYEWTEKIKKRYSLLENWDTSIMTVILTNHLPIPEPLYTIGYYMPMTEAERKAAEEEKPKTFAERLSSPSLTRTWAVTSHPAIYFSSQTSPTALIHWIEKNKPLLRMMNKNLKRESSISSRMTVRTLRIGQAVLFTSWGKIKRWSDMEKTYDDWEKEDDHTDYWGEEGTPTAEDFRIAFQSYYSVMKKLESGNSESL